MQKTNNYSLNKPDKEDFYNIEDFNENAEIIDAALSKKVNVEEGKALSDNNFTNELKEKLEQASENKHSHTNKSAIDKITQALINAWNSAVEHINDTVKHITAEERSLWNGVKNKADSGHTHDNRYYTETEIDNKLSGYSAVNHSHNYAGSQTAGGAANNALLLGNNVMDIGCGGSGGDALYRKILTLSTDIASGENGFIAIVSGGVNFGDDTNVGFGVLEMTTRQGNLVPKYTQLTLSNIKFGYVNNGNGTTSIWLLKGSYCHPIHMLVTMKSGITINNDSETATAPSGLTYGTINTFIDSSNYKNIVTPSNIGAVATSASCNKNWNWNGKGGQPQWLWGSDDGTNMYVYNPSNFSVNYANTAHALRTYAANGNSHGGEWLLNCQHNLDGDNLFKIYVGNKSIGVKVDRASAADLVDWGNIQNKPTSFTPASHTHSYLPLSGGTVSGNLSVTGNVEAAGTIKGSAIYNALWGADYAETFDFEGEQPEVGEIVEIYDKRKLRKAEENSRKVIGVVSDTYCILAGSDEKEVENGTKIAVGLLGQLPIKIIGKVEAGDFIASTSNGIGIKADENVPRGSIIGRALESNPEENIKMVYCLIQPQ